MAIKKVTAERAALQAFDKKHEDKELTAAQEQQREQLENAAKAADFVALATRKGNTVVRGITGLTKMVGGTRYSYTPKQKEVILKAFSDALAKLAGAFDGKATGGDGLKLD